jgi:hypothetical protein
MTFVPRPGSLVSPAALAFVVLLGAFSILTSGCDDKHIGRLCSLNTGSADAGTTTGSTATINPEALECPSRICLLPGAENGGTDTAPLCTADCSSDDDCSDGETGPRGNTMDHHCETGFACVIPTTVGDFCCRRFCVCKDFINPQTIMNGYTPPKVCQSGQGSTCKNVH